MPTWTHAVAKKAAIAFKISESLPEISLNPGVSMSATLLPSRVNLSTTWTSVVLGCGPVPTHRFEPLARLINWGQQSELLIIVAKHPVLTVDFPLPAGPMTLRERLEKVSTGERALRYVRDHDGWADGWLMLGQGAMNLSAVVSGQVKGDLNIQS